MVNASYRRGAVSIKSLSCQDLAEKLSLVIQGDVATPINGVTTLDSPKINRAIFLDHFDEKHVIALRKAPEKMLVIAPEEYTGEIKQTHMVTSSPRPAFAAVIETLFPEVGSVAKTLLHPSAEIDKTAIIGVNTVIGAGVKIGPRTKIHSSVIVGANVTIGADCIIKSGTIIGQAGFGIHYDEQGTPQTMPHVGGVIIENRVLIGALNTVVAGTIHPTVLENDVKCDDHVHIAHNCHIGMGTLLTACAELSGSVTVGPKSWIGPNASIRDGLVLGAQSFVGIGSVVVRNVEDNTTVLGNPARKIRKKSQ